MHTTPLSLLERLRPTWRWTTLPPSSDNLSSKTFDEVVEYDSVRIGLTAGNGYDGRMARLYSLKAENLAR
jgi:hypothetical protein